MIHLVLLSGGSGTRLWPLSNASRSKQFLKVLRDDKGDHISMVQRVFSQIERVDKNFDITIATTANQESSIKRQVKGEYDLVLEPERRDTAPAIMLTCAYLSMVRDCSSDDTVIVMPIDTFADQNYYDSILLLDDALKDDNADLVLLGVEPTYPSEKFGYIVPNQTDGCIREVLRFVEKPDFTTASMLIDESAFWNCGVFAFKLGWLNAIRESYCDVASYEELIARYSELPKNSFDYEVVERAKSVAVVPYCGLWKDLGTWNALSDEMIDKTAGRVVLDEKSCDNIHVINETGLPMIVAGISDSVIVATPDGILISGKEESQEIRSLVAFAAESRPMYERRRWGEYRVLDSSVYSQGIKSLTKELVLENGKQISYQRHGHRTEVWTVVSGEGEVAIDGDVQHVHVGSVVRILPDTLHAARAMNGDLRIIEVQLGDVLDESDIERYGDYWIRGCEISK